MDKDVIKLLEQINKSLAEVNIRQKTAEEMEDVNKILDRSDKRVEYSSQQIQSTFDRIHDKIFNFNNILIGAFLVLGTFPSNAPQVKLWTIIFPILNMVFIIYIDIRQIEIHRYATGEQDWNDSERDNYGKKINNQTLLSLLALFLSICCLIYLIMKVV
ncbi:hypothetical protein [Flavobacterium sp. WC2509]|uniref:hypothetical protein n=1 Tax=Flavobacterium sp. WC2509 TaxID=3461406 RepID=UPI00404394EE